MARLKSLVNRPTSNGHNVRNVDILIFDFVSNTKSIRILAYADKAEAAASENAHIFNCTQGGCDGELCDSIVSAVVYY